MEIHNEPAEGLQNPEEPRRVLMRPDRNMRVSREEWEVIKALYCAGEKATILAPKYGIKPATINKRAAEEKWPTPQRITRATNNPKFGTNDPAQALADLWAERGEQSREDTFQGSKKALQRFFAMSPIPQSFQEAAIAQKMLNEAVNPSGSKETSNTNVNIAVLTNQGFVPKQQVVDV